MRAAASAFVCARRSITVSHPLPLLHFLPARGLGPASKHHGGRGAGTRTASVPPWVFGTCRGQPRGGSTHLRGLAPSRSLPPWLSWPVPPLLSFCLQPTGCSGCQGSFVEDGVQGQRMGPKPGEGRPEGGPWGSPDRAGVLGSVVFHSSPRWAPGWLPSAGTGPRLPPLATGGTAGTRRASRKQVVMVGRRLCQLLRA